MITETSERELVPIASKDDNDGTTTSDEEEKGPQDKVHVDGTKTFDGEGLSPFVFAHQGWKRLEKELLIIPAPNLKIEGFGAATIDRVFLLNTLSFLFAFANIIAIVAIGAQFIPQSLVLEAMVVHFLNGLMVAIVTLSYPQRILRLFCGQSKRPTTEQLVILFYVVFSFFNPYVSIWGLGLQFRAYRGADASYGETLMYYNSSLVAQKEQWSFFFEYISWLPFDTVFTYTVLAGCLKDAGILCLAILLLGIRYSLKKSEERYLDGFEEHDSISKESDPVNRDGGRRSGSEEDVGNEEGDELHALELAVHSKIIHEQLEGQHFDGNFLKFLFSDWVWLTHLFVAVLLITLKPLFGVLFDYIPSGVSLVSIVTIIKICTATPVYPYPGLTVSMCRNGQPFRRMMASVGLIILEVLQGVTLYLLIKKTRRTLSRVPYVRTRGKQIAFLFMCAQVFLFGYVVELVAFLLVAVPGNNLWIFRTERIWIDVNGTAVSIPVSVYDPLFNVGITGYSLGMYYLYFLMGTVLFTLTLSHLPNDSYGIVGWWCPMSKKPDAHTPTAVELKFMEEEELTMAEKRLFMRTMKKRLLQEEIDAAQPLYVRSEDQVLLILESWPIIEMVRKSIQAGNVQITQPADPQKRPTLLPVTKPKSNRPLEVHETVRSLLDIYKAEQEAETAPDPAFFKQVRDSNFFVLESEILAFNFTNATYWLGYSRQPKTFDQEKAIIEDERFTLEAHLHDYQTDTHCLIAYSFDRVMVAFRGTYSETNAKTDLNLKLVEWPIANDPWLVESLPADYESFFAEKGWKAEVHNGFTIAYASVRDKLTEILAKLCLNETKTRQTRAIHFCGHSLGGALSTLAAFDMAVRLRKLLGPSVGALCVSTFGSPRCGNFTFAKRYNLLVPNTKRFANPHDIIPRTPPATLGHSISFSGYYHVGMLVMVTNEGRLIMAPSKIEKYVQRSIFHTSTKAHATSRYAYALMLWCTRVHFREFNPKFWLICSDKIHEHAQGNRTRIDSVLYGRFNDVLRQGGILYKSGGKRLRNRGIQVDYEEEFASGDEIDDEEEEMVSLLRKFQKCVKDQRKRQRNDQVTAEDDSDLSLIKSKMLEYISQT